MTSRKMWKQWKQITQNKLNNSQDQSVVSQCKSSSSSHFNKITFTKKTIEESKQKSQKSLKLSTLQKARKSVLQGPLGLISKKNIPQQSVKNKQVDPSNEQSNLGILNRIKSKNWSKVNKYIKQARRQHLLLQKSVRGVIDQFQNIKSELQSNMKKFVKAIYNMCQEVQNLQSLKLQLTKVQQFLNQSSKTKVNKMPSFQSSIQNQRFSGSQSKLTLNSLIKQPHTPKLFMHERSESPKRQTTGQRQHMSIISTPKLNQFGINNNGKKNIGSMVLINNQKRPITERKKYQNQIGDSFDKQLSHHKDGSIYLDDESVRPLYEIVNQMRSILNQTEIDEIM